MSYKAQIESEWEVLEVITISGDHKEGLEVTFANLWSYQDYEVSVQTVLNNRTSVAAHKKFPIP